MIILNIKLNHVYGFDDFQMNFTYPRKLSVSLIGEEALAGRRFPAAEKGFRRRAGGSDGSGNPIHAGGCGSRGKS